MNQPPTFFAIPVEMYYVEVMVSIAQSNQELHDSVKNHYPDYDEGIENVASDKHGSANIFNNGNCVLKLYKHPDTPYWRGILAHEIFHITTFIAEHVGLKLHDSSDEAYAYLNEYLTEQVYSKLEELKHEKFNS